MYSLDINEKQFNDWLDEVRVFSEEFLRELPKKWAYKNQEKFLLEKKSPFLEPHAFRDVLSEFKSLLEAGGVNTASGKFMGYIPGGGVPTAAIGDFLAALTNRFSGMFYTSPGAQKIENDLIKWMCELFGYPETAWGTLTSGGAIANLTAILAAREKVPFPLWTNHVIYLSSECHMTIDRALKVAGLEFIATRKIPVDLNFRMDLNALEDQMSRDAREGLRPWMICANAGATNLGSIDPLEEIGRLCQRHGIWFHVDAAYGGFFILTNRGKRKLRGIEFADSITLDPHKGLFQPYGVGAVIVKDRENLRKAVSQSASYLAETNSSEISQSDYSLELTRHFRALRVWLSLKIFSEKAFEFTLNEKLELTKIAREGILRTPGLKLIVDEPELSVLGFHAINNDVTQKLHKEILRRGKVYLSTTNVRGKHIIRICILSFRTHKAELDICIGEVREALAAIA
ncbi:MAG: hypothetical protein A4S09_05180 [Proteobacteria bacterium SG_bin7]|nr:MAG: hypothetical protein A4S09_05180 [Proteobacteria bacterium SG_bin7]